MPEFDTTAMLFGFLFSSIGFVAFRYGRKMQHAPGMVLGGALMIYPMFVAKAGWIIVVGLCLTSGFWLWRE